MKKDRHKTEIGTVESGLKSSQRRPLFNRQESNSAQGKKRELQTADRILLLMQEEEKY
ncbi:MAG TPA: hypothetical protein VFV86_09060 [Nitrososphaeraceae archaeon]|jgi:hypothetical protein|nr:hypothetical protein [Nitrososphaeraceae archaeon]